MRVDHHAATKSRAANAWPAVDRSKSSVLKGERLLAPDCDMAALTFTSTAPSRAATAATCASYEARAALVASAGGSLWPENRSAMKQRELPELGVGPCTPAQTSYAGASVMGSMFASSTCAWSARKGATISCKLGSEIGWADADLQIAQAHPDCDQVRPQRERGRFLVCQHVGGGSIGYRKVVKDGLMWKPMIEKDGKGLPNRIVGVETNRLAPADRHVRVGRHMGLGPRGHRRPTAGAARRHQSRRRPRDRIAKRP